MTIPNQLAQILRELVVSQRVRFFSRLDLKVIYSKPLSFTSGLLLGCFTFIPLKKLCIYIYTTHTFHDFLYTPHNFISSKTNVGVFFFPGTTNNRRGRHEESVQSSQLSKMVTFRTRKRMLGSAFSSWGRAIFPGERKSDALELLGTI